MSAECVYFAAKGMHLYVGWRHPKSGETFQACHGCGAALAEGEKP